MAILMPVNSIGQGSRQPHLEKQIARVAPMVRSSAISSGSAERRPSAVLTTMGKKQTSATTITLGSMP